MMDASLSQRKSSISSRLSKKRDLDEFILLCLQCIEESSWWLKVSKAVRSKTTTFHEMIYDSEREAPTNDVTFKIQKSKRDWCARYVVCKIHLVQDE